MKDIEKQYQTLNFDTEGILKRRIWAQICAKESSFKRTTVRVCLAAAAIVLAVIVWQMRPTKPAYLPSPDELNRMQFNFYRELALPGQDLGISYDDFAQTQRSNL